MRGSMFSNTFRFVLYLSIVWVGWANLDLITHHGYPRVEAYADLWWSFVSSVFWLTFMALLRGGFGDHPT
jgi:hypothetical protein